MNQSKHTTPELLSIVYRCQKYGELLAFSIMATEKQDKKIQNNFIEEFLPKNKDIIKKFLKND